MSRVPSTSVVRRDVTRGKWVTVFIPLVDPALGSAEEIAVDDQGNILAGFTAIGKMTLKKFVKNYASVSVLAESF